MATEGPEILRNAELLSDRKPSSPEERVAMQEAKIAALRERLLKRGSALADMLVKGGEFRPGEEPWSDTYLKRWLRARYWKLNDAESSLVQHADWRISFCPAGRIKEADVSNELAAGKVFLQGTDKKGRGFLVILAAKHSAWTRDTDELSKMMCYGLDAQLDAADASINPHRRGVTLFDLTDIGLANVDMEAMYLVKEVLGDHFVERLDTLYIYNAPTVFWATWKAFSPVIPEATMKKIKIVYDEDLAELKECVQPEILPETYGGKANLLPIEETLARIKREQVQS